MFSFVQRLLPLLFLLLCASCQHFLPEIPDATPAETAPAVSTPIDPKAKPLAASSWDEEANKTATGSPKIVIDIKNQQGLFYRGNTLIGTAAVSTGKLGRGTPRGNYRVEEKHFVRYSSAFGIIRDKDTHEILMPDFDTRRDSRPKNGYYEPARMAYCLRFYNGFCFHEGYVPGYPASHGCVRIVPEMAPLFFENARAGMSFIVK